MAVESPFTGWTPLTTSFLGQDTIIPRNTFITGKTHGVAGPSRDPHTLANSVKFQLKCDIPTSPAPLNDYTSIPVAATVAYTVSICIREFTPSEEDKTGQWRKALEQTVRKTVEVDVGGFKVVSVVRDEKGLSVVLEGTGETIVRLPKTVVKIFEDDKPGSGSTQTPSATPGWFLTPEPSASPPPARQQPPEGYRPITSIPVPPISLNAQAGPSRLGMASNVSKRSVSPEKAQMASKRQKMDTEVPFPRHNGFMQRKALQQVVAVETETTEAMTIERELIRTDTEVSASLDEPENLPRTRSNGNEHDTPVTTPASNLERLRMKVESTNRSYQQSRSTPYIAGHSPTPPPAAHRRSSDVFLSKAERSSPSMQSARSVLPDHRLSTTTGPAGATKAASMQHVDPAISLNPVTPHAAPLTAFAKAQIKRAAAVESARARQEQERAHTEASTMALRQVASAGLHRYLPLSDVRDGLITNVMGVVVEHPPQPRVPARAGRDWNVSVVIGDPSSHEGGPGSEGVVVTIMRPDEAALPRLHKGQTILFRELKMSMFNGKIKGNAFSRAANGAGIAKWAILGAGGKVKQSTEEMEVSPEEIHRLQSLADWWKNFSQIGTEPSTVNYIDEGGSPGKRGNVALSSVQPGDFLAATLKIVHVIANDRSPFYELYVTDGTVNPSPTNNFHNVDIGIPPSAVFCLVFFDQQPDVVVFLFHPGKFIHLTNINVKRHRGAGPLELKWSEKVTEDQKAMGWKNRLCSEVLSTDHRATEINRRINELKREWSGEAGPSKPSDAAPQPGQSTALLPSSSRSTEISLPEGPPQLATHLSTTFTDDIYHPQVNLTDVQQNTFFPNRFRVQARVKSIHPRMPPASNGEPSYVCYYCNDCAKTYTPSPSNLCSHCKKTSANNELRYRFIILLGDKETEAFLLVDGKEAEEFLPPLPPIQHTTNPNDAKKQETTLRENREKVDSILLGAKMNGQRPRPIIDWTMEAYIVPTKGNKGSVAALRVFGMKGQ